MKYAFTGLIFLAILSTTTLAVPVERGDDVLHRPSSRHGHLSLHRGLSHRIRAAIAKLPQNLTFAPAGPMDNFVHVEYGASHAADFRFSATLLKRGRDDEIVAEHFSGNGAQTALCPPDSYEGHRVTISIRTYPFTTKF